jgi:hypothetical protein
MLKYRHPDLGRFEKLDIRKGGIATILVSEKELGELTTYMNGSGMPGRNRILDILHDMQRLESIEPAVFSERIEGSLRVERKGRFEPNPKFKKVAPEKYRVQLEIDRLQASINERLARYRFWPHVLSPHQARWVVAWSPKRRGAGYEMGEEKALEIILNLARAAHLNRLRTCTHCQRWLYAKFRHQTFCSTKCQQLQYTQTEEFKANRRLYMRRYYQENFSGRFR